jgi:hypothetical protein
MLGFFVAAYSTDTLAAAEYWRHVFAAAVLQEEPPLPPKKVFSPSFDLPPVTDYRVDPGPDFWANFPVNNKRIGKSWVDPNALGRLAIETGFQDLNLLATVCNDLRHGATIGCREQFRKHSVSSNAASAYQFAPHITDAIAGWVTKGIAAGPFDPAHRPADVKINGIMCREKPNGSARIILNMSAPAGLSVNDGINKDDFPAAMSSTAKWLNVLNLAGKNCQIMKIDWSDAYKHVHVCEDDLKLQ